MLGGEGEEEEGREAAVSGGRGSVIYVSGRQIPCDANDWLKLLPLLRTDANMTANKGATERCRIPAVTQLSPKISQTGVPLSPAVFKAPRMGPLSRFHFFSCIKVPLIHPVIEFVPSYNAVDAHSIKYEVVFPLSEALFLSDCYLLYHTLLPGDLSVYQGAKQRGTSLAHDFLPVAFSYAAPAQLVLFLI